MITPAWHEGFDPMETKEWNQGYDSAVTGEQYNNPYPKHTTEYELFERGWIDATEWLEDCPK